MMGLVWYSQAGRNPPRDEVGALSLGIGEKLVLKMFQVARDAEEGAQAHDWFTIKTQIEIKPIAWSDVISVVVYILVLRGGYYSVFSWDRADVMVLSIGRSRDKASEAQVIELALRRFEQSRGVGPGAANWQTESTQARRP